MAAATPAPDPSLEQSGEKLSIMEEVRATLRKVRQRTKTGRLNEDSRLFKVKQKLTEMATADDVERRRQYLIAAEALDPEAAEPA